MGWLGIFGQPILLSFIIRRELATTIATLMLISTAVVGPTPLMRTSLIGKSVGKEMYSKSNSFQNFPPKLYKA